MPRYFLITIDAEGDNLWQKPRHEVAKNAEFLPRFQTMCDEFGLKPTYLCDYVIVQEKAFLNMARSWLEKDRCEIGMHLHAWNTPPFKQLTQDDHRSHPYLINFDESLMRRKVEELTNLLSTLFLIRPRSHRAGRWAFNSKYAQVLADLEYYVDCSVTPLVSWAHQRPMPELAGGVDYRAFPNRPYFLELQNIRRSGFSKLLEIPMTIRHRKPNLMRVIRRIANRMHFGERWTCRTAPHVNWLRPDGKNLRSMLEVVSTVDREGQDYIEFMIHSSEFMPGGSPYFPTIESIEVLYQHLEQLFKFATNRGFQGATLTEFYHNFVRSK
jgi:hypothetical protein